MINVGDSLFLNELDIQSDWMPFLSEEVVSLVVSAEQEVQKNGFTPEARNVLRFFAFPLQNVRVIILGQDPYPQPGVATGRAFEVGTLQSWNQPFSNISLKNILRSLYKAYTGQIITFNKVREKLDNEFPVLPPGRLFEHWESQGVLLINRSFTCTPGRSGSHQKIWREFSQQLLQFISVTLPDATWFLWGNHAREVVHDLKRIKTIQSMHPMMCYNRPDDFLYGKQNCFKPFIGQIDWTGYGFRRDKKSQATLFNSNQSLDCSL